MSAGDAVAAVVVPAAAPLAEVSPLPARAVGMLDAETAVAGFRVELQPGRVLDAERSLVAQGVHTGAALVVRCGVLEAPPCRYDDVVRPPPTRRLRLRRRPRAVPAATTRTG